MVGDEKFFKWLMLPGKESTKIVIQIFLKMLWQNYEFNGLGKLNLRGSKRNVRLR